MFDSTHPAPQSPQGSQGGDTFTTVRDLFEKLYLTHRIPGASYSTIRQYNASLNNFDLYLGRAATLDDLRDHICGAIPHWMINTRKRSPQSALKWQDNILAIWRFAFHKRLVDRWPDVAMVKPPVKAPTAWTRDELVILFDSIDRETGNIAGIPAALYWRLLVSLLWESGERVNAILQVQWADLDIKTRWLNVRAEYRKGKTADNAVRLHRETIAHLRKLSRHTHPEESKIMPWPYDIGSLFNRYRKVLERAGLPTGRERMFHCIRRSAASHFQAAGFDASKMLGHSDQRVTRKYIDPRIVTLPQVSDVLFRPDGGKGERQS